jgi:hypothetical protein
MTRSSKYVGGQIKKKSKGKIKRKSDPGGTREMMSQESVSDRLQAGNLVI